LFTFSGIPQNGTDPALAKEAEEEAKKDEAATEGGEEATGEEDYEKEKEKKEKEKKKDKKKDKKSKDKKKDKKNEDRLYFNMTAVPKVGLSLPPASFLPPPASSCLLLPPPASSCLLLPPASLQSPFRLSLSPPSFLPTSPLPFPVKP
jgi:chromatin remodeling complex protein RSC6